jgi:hypothetical protein
MALTPKHDRMNRALDEPMSSAELAEFQAFLEAEQEDAALYARLRVVDDMLRRPPVVAPKPDFASKVMARIEAGEHEAYAPNPSMNRFMLWLGLVGSVVAVPLLLILLIMVPAFAAPGAFISVFQEIIKILGGASAIIGSLLTFLGNLIAAYPMAPALALTVIPLTMVWAWLVWYLQRNRPETIVIKVQAVGSTS